MVDQTAGDTFSIRRLMEAIAHSSSALALKLLAYYLNVRTKRITDDFPDDGTGCDSSSRRAEKHEQLLRDTIWYEIGELFGSHPKEFMNRFGHGSSTCLIVLAMSVFRSTMHTEATMD